MRGAAGELNLLAPTSEAYMQFTVEKYREMWGQSPRDLLKEYRYQPTLTSKLDGMNASEFDREAFYEIVLWKLNRFPQIDDRLLESLKELSLLEPRQHRRAASQLRSLLECQGIALPMASTVLRFINPNVFQIIDDRVYRIVYPGKSKYPSKPLKVSTTYLDNSESIYFDYLDALHEISSEELPFFEADRILYQLDIKLGNKVGDRG